MGVTAITSCTSTDVVDQSVQSNAISFENAIKKPSRAVSGDLTQTNFDQFSVYGYYTKTGMEGHPMQIFTGDLVNKTTTDGKTSWTYNSVRYWVPDAKFHFYAYSCGDIALGTGKGNASMVLAGSSMDDRALKINDYVCDADHQHDLITAMAENITGQTSGNTPVKFVFKHALCKVSADFVNDFPAGYDIYISDVKLTNFYDKANCSLRSTVTTGDDNRVVGNVWSNQSRSADNKIIAMDLKTDNKATSTTEYGDKATKVETHAIFMIPVEYNNANVNIEFTLSVKQGDDEFLNRTIKGTWRPVWEPGKAYNYIVHITGNTAQLEPIVFEASHDITDVSSPDGWNADIMTDMNFSM